MRTPQEPRYLRIAKWLLQQDAPLTSKEIAEHFHIAVRDVCADFFLMRKRSDVIEAQWFRNERNGFGKTLYRVRVLRIHPYCLDRRNHPQRSDAEKRVRKKHPLSWQQLLSARWDSLNL